MNKILSWFLLTLLTASAQASEFKGGFVGARLGVNNSDISGTAAASSKSTTAYGLDAGYNWDVRKLSLGANLFMDFNDKSDHSTAAAPFTTNYGSDAYGLDFKLGLPNGSWMPYGRLGYAHTKGTNSASAVSGGDLHGGLGLEYKYTPNWGLSAEWMRSAAKANNSTLTNDNYTFGLRYYFGTPAPAPAPMPVAEKAAPMQEPKAAPAPAPAPQERWKTILTEKPIRLDGANFASGSYRLLKTADARLSEVADTATQHPEIRLEVSGHTDSTGNKASNQKLSENRAAAVKAWLVQHGIAADRITTAGYADTRPVADNKTKAGRAANRRVEIQYVIREEKKVRVNE